MFFSTLWYRIVSTWNFCCCFVLFWFFFDDSFKCRSYTMQKKTLFLDPFLLPGKISITTFQFGTLLSESIFFAWIRYSNFALNQMAFVRFNHKCVHKSSKQTVCIKLNAVFRQCLQSLVINWTITENGIYNIQYVWHAYKHIR